MTEALSNGEVSWWMSRTVTPTPRPALPGDRSCDVAIVGAGYTGLWTAYWLTRAVPAARIMVIDARTVGYGASGRNGGWLSAKMVGLRRHLVDGPRGRAGVVDLQDACREAVGEVLVIMAEHGHDVDATRGGYLQVARGPAELDRVQATVREDHQWGLGPEDVRLLDVAELAERVRVRDALGALYSPHAATLNPAKLVTALAALVEEAGVSIHEHTVALELSPGQVRTDRGVVTAPVVLRATEGYTPTLPGGWADLLPMNSSMIVTEPLGPGALATIGWDGREGMSGASHRYFYAQRTADDRIALGGRGLPYRFGSRVDSDGHLDRWTIHQLHRVLVELFPVLQGVRLDHAWCGLLGVPRDWSPSVCFDPRTGLGSAGGYVGQGVAASYVAARSLADLVAGEETRFSSLPWVNRPTPRWEREPLRFLGAYSMFGLYQLADVLERRRPSSRTALPAQAADRLSGRH